MNFHYENAYHRTYKYELYVLVFESPIKKKFKKKIRGLIMTTTMKRKPNMVDIWH